jgi:hypothetical protein
MVGALSAIDDEHPGRAGSLLHDLLDTDDVLGYVLDLELAPAIDGFHVYVELRHGAGPDEGLVEVGVLE